jgi:hypothetical protein
MTLKWSLCVCCHAAVLVVAARTKENVYFIEADSFLGGSPDSGPTVQERAEVSCDFQDTRSESDAAKVNLGSQIFRSRRATIRGEESSVGKKR